jgi:hypothetical protein
MLFSLLFIMRENGVGPSVASQPEPQQLLNASDERMTAVCAQPRMSDITGVACFVPCALGAGKLCRPLSCVAAALG